MRKKREKDDEAKGESHKSFHIINGNDDLLFIFDLETTIDLLQNCKVGFYMVVNFKTKKIIDASYFYRDKFNSKEEIKILKKFCEDGTTKLYTLDEFIKRFFKWVLFERATCLGFNILFDSARISKKHTDTQGKRFHNGFSLVFVNNKAYPRVKIASRGSKYSFIEFSSCPFNKRNNFYPGRFIDLHTLALALSGEKSINLKYAGKLFEAKDIKEDSPEHGKITPEYLRYLARDVLCTYSLYEALIKNLSKYGKDFDPTKIYTSASLGKAILKKIGFKSFFEQNAGFPDWMLGYIMEAFYGGLAVVYRRQLSKKYSLLDVTSMYPLVNILTKMQDFILAEKIEYMECTEEIQKFLTEIELEDLQDPKIYEKLSCICIIQSDVDELPQRMRFNPKSLDTNIAVCKSHSTIDQIYALPDLIRTKISTGKTPIIKKAYRFIPNGIQKNLNKINVLGRDLDVKKQNIFLEFVNEIQKLKQKMKGYNSDSMEYKILKSESTSLKLITNSTGYGVYMETNGEPLTKKQKDSGGIPLEVYGLESFESKGRYENPGEFFNPILATIITSTSRLLLGIMEQLVKEEKERPGFCDTDSLAVPERLVKKIQDFFRPLNPYIEGVELIKEEIHDAWFLGISSKRYCFYEFKENGDINIIKFSGHGLGQYMDPIGKKDDWYKTVWQLGIRIFHFGEKKEIINKEFGDIPALSRLSVTNKSTYQIVRNLHEGENYDEQFKPGGFCCKGLGNKVDPKTGKLIRPIAPFNTDLRKILRSEFIDAETGEKHLPDRSCWRPLASVIRHYLENKEHKLEGDTGDLQMKTVYITDKKKIGKEVNVTNPMDPPDVYENIEKDKPFIRNNKVKDVMKKYGVCKRTVLRWRKDAQIKEL
jgi:hypothetical protein